MKLVDPCVGCDITTKEDCPIAKLAIWVNCPAAFEYQAKLEMGKAMVEWLKSQAYQIGDEPYKGALKRVLLQLASKLEEALLETEGKCR